MDKTVQEQIDVLKSNLDALTQEVYRNNFSNHQDFNKNVTFSTRLKVPHYDIVPVIGEQGEIIESGGKLYVCSATNVYTIVGTQT